MVWLNFNIKQNLFCFFLKSFRSLFHYYGEPEGREGEKGYGWGGGEGGVGGDGGEHLLPLPLFPLWLSHSASRLLWHDWKATSQPPSPTSVPPLTLTGYFSGWATRCALTPTWWLSTGGLAIRFSCHTRWTAGENNLAKACHAKEIKVDQIIIIISRSAADETKPYLASVFRLKSADDQFLKRNLKSEMSLFQPQPGNGKEGRWMPGKKKTVSLLSSLSLTSWLSSLSLSSWLSSLSSWFLWSPLPQSTSKWRRQIAQGAWPAPLQQQQNRGKGCCMPWSANHKGFYCFPFLL